MRSWRNVVQRVGLCTGVLALALTAAGADSGASLSASTAYQPVGEVMGKLYRLDPLTLKPQGRGVELGEYHDGWSFSPSGKQIALGMGSPAVPTCGAGICVIDLDARRIVQDIDGPVAAEAIGWVSPRRIVAVLQGAQVLVADPVTGEIVRERDLPGVVYGPQSALRAGRYVVVVGRRAPSLVAVGANGRIRAADLAGLGEDRPDVAVTIDPVARRALVFAGATSVAEVDLGTMRVRYHRLRESAASAAAGGRADAAISCADWLGHGLVVGYGETVRVVDTRTWKARTLKTRAAQAAVAGRRLLAFTHNFSEEGEGVGLRIYTLDGRRLIAHRFGDQRLNLQVADPYAYAVAPHSVRTVRARTGRLIDKSRRRWPGFVNLLGTRSGSGFCTF